MQKVFKKTLLCIFIFCLVALPAYAKDKYVFFVEDASYKDMLKYSEINGIINNSVRALSIQRKNTGDFSFFQSIKDKKPSSISDSMIPVLDSSSNFKISGYVLKDGTFYVPSMIFFNGQSYGENIFYVHVNNIEALNNHLGDIKGKEADIVIVSWTREKFKGYEYYLMPLIYYDGEHRGVFYSKTTRNLGILDYENINSLIFTGELKGLSVEKGNIENIYRERIKSLKNKRVFLTIYGYFLAAVSIVNSILSRISYKRGVSILSSMAAASPLAILMEPILRLSDINLIILVILILSMALGFFTLRKKGTAIIAVTFLVLIYFDSLTMNFFLRNSLLSYEPALGARFYGIGNEYLGVILAYSMIIIGELKKGFGWLIWGINAILLLLNSAGNNFGGFLTCGFMVLVNSSVTAAALIAVLGGVIIYFSQNHIGKFFREVLQGDIQYLYSMLSSKLQTLKKLLSLSIWTKLSIISLIVYLIEFFRGRFKYYGNAYQIVVCCIVVTITNDSGIVSMALLLGIYINYMFFKNNLEEK